MKRLLPIVVAATIAALAGWPGASPASASVPPAPYVPPHPPTGALITPSGVVVAVLATLPGGWLVSTPCTEVGVVTEGTFVPRADVVLDPGHGGSESGAVGANGLVERDLNLTISARVEQILAAEGYVVQRTRTQDYRLPIRSRADIANALAPSVFVSIHHNGGAVAQRSTPGSEVYFQPGDDQSERLATLMWDENFRAMSGFGSSFVGTHYAGTVTRHREDGEPLHGVLRYTPDLVSVISEPLYLSHPPEATLLARADVQEAEAQAIARAIRRWFGDEPPVAAKYTRVDDASSTGTGGTENCTDPDLGTSLLDAGSLPATAPSVFTPLTPTRLFDTRHGPGPVGKLAAGATLDVVVAGEQGVPADAEAVVVNLTATEATDDGFVTAFPTGYPRPLASNLNLRSGQTAPNLVVVPLGGGGAVSFYTQSGTHLLGDVLGYFTPSEAATAGRYVPLPPERLFDTREPGGSSGIVAAGTTRSVAVLGQGSLPASGVSAVVVNLTGTEAVGAGFVTAWGGGERPTASTLNLAGAGDENANLAVVPVAADGSIQLYSQRGVHLVGDAVGYFTDATAPPTTAGRFVAFNPSRLADTRTAAPPSGYLPIRGATSAAVTGKAGVPSSGAVAVMANLTATEAGGPGFVTVWASDLALPPTSTLNVGRTGETRPNAAIVTPGVDGSVNLYAHSGAHLILDASGYFTN